MSILDTAIILSLRKQKGWEQKDLANAAGVNPAVISRLERGIQTDFKLSIIVAIAKALDVPIDNLVTKDYQVRQIKLDPLLNASINRLSISGLNNQRTIASIIDAFLNSNTGDQT